VTVSCDTKYVHLAWRTIEGELENVRYQMGSDPTGALARMFGVYVAEEGIALRGAFLISPHGVLVNSEVNFLNMGRNVDELMRKFKANIYLARKTGEAVPAKWKEEGDLTLTPSEKMVGKVRQYLERQRSGQREPEGEPGPRA
jgi:peroxiredoxin (alkyl hydroperoxide reductase subunit C)